AFCTAYRKRLKFVCSVVPSSAVALEFLQTLTQIVMANCWMPPKRSLAAC
ncbi:hypothetical protein ABIB84_008538, partial [Bradyrhizobium sp. JR1.1]